MLRITSRMTHYTACFCFDEDEIGTAADIQSAKPKGCRVEYVRWSSITF